MNITIEVPENELNDYVAYHGWTEEVEDRTSGVKREKIPNPQSQLEFFKQALERHIGHGIITKRKNEAEKVAWEAITANLDLTVA